MGWEVHRQIRRQKYDLNLLTLLHPSAAISRKAINAKQRQAKKQRNKQAKRSRTRNRP